MKKIILLSTPTYFLSCLNPLKTVQEAAEESKDEFCKDFIDINIQTYDSTKFKVQLRKFPLNKNKGFIGRCSKNPVTYYKANQKK